MALCAADVTKPPQPPTDGSSGSRFLRHTTSAELEDYMNEEMTPDYMTGTPNTVCADARRQFSRIGLMFLVGTALIYGVQFGASAIANAINPDLLSSTSYALLIVMIPMYVIAMPIMALLIKRIPAVTLPKKHMTFGQWLIAFLMCYGAMYVSNYTGLILTQLISILKGSPVTNTMLEVATSSNLWVNLFIMVLCAPVAEELIFRKLLIDRLAQYGEGVAVLFSGLMFGLFHGNLNQFVYAFVLGLCFGFIYVKTGNIRYTIGLHMLVNFLGSVLGVAILKWLGDDFLCRHDVLHDRKLWKTDRLLYLHFPFARRGDCRYYSLYRQSEENPLPAWNEHDSERKTLFHNRVKRWNGSLHDRLDRDYHCTALSIMKKAAAGIPFYRFYSCDSFYYAIFTALSRSFSNFPRSAHPVHLRCS